MVRTHDGLVKCDCPSYGHDVRRNRFNTCKHGQALVKAGLLEAPCPVPNVKPTVAPVTQADVKRAAYFKLHIPASAPTVVEAPAPVFEAEPAFVQPGEGRIVFTDPGESWETWTDEDDSRWTITEEEPASAIDLTAFCSQPMVVEVESPVDALDDAPHGMEWVKLSPVASVLRNVLDRPVREPRPTHLDRFVPSPEMEAEWLGMTLGLAGENAKAPRGSSLAGSPASTPVGWPGRRNTGKNRPSGWPGSTRSTRPPTTAYIRRNWPRRAARAAIRASKEAA